MKTDAPLFACGGAPWPSRSGGCNRGQHGRVERHKRWGPLKTIQESLRNTSISNPELGHVRPQSPKSGRFRANFDRHRAQHVVEVSQYLPNLGHNSVDITHSSETGRTLAETKFGPHHPKIWSNPAQTQPKSANVWVEIGPCVGRNGADLAGLR